ncbi:MAG: glucuronate isomerase, partial [archaeon]|nr:glucuronate isomerase [archaeon]
NYLLTNKSASIIYKEVEDLPILDMHNHGDAHEIAENENYSDIWQVEAATDHYMWEVMRKRGVEEKFITGEATNYEKWMKLASIFEDLVGNPAYEWVHLDLKHRLGINELISQDTAQLIWDKAKEVLLKDNKKPQALLKEMNIESMCTTNDPLEMLEAHKKLSESLRKGFIRPTWRPDKAMTIFKDNFPDYIRKLGERTNIKIQNIDDLIKSLKITHDYFAEFGCIASDHGVESPYGYKVSKLEANAALKKKLNKKELSEVEQQTYMSYMLHEFGKMNAEKNWVMQIHMGAVRNVRNSLLENIGPDSGGDISDIMIEVMDPILDFLNEFDENNTHIDEKYRGLKVVLYCLDPNHQNTLATLTRAFGKNVNLGSAWWFNDTPVGMKRQLEYIMSVDLLMNFAGMVSDSRKILSYGSRTEMFRRILSDILGNMVEKGQIPENLAIKMAKYVCYEGPKSFFNF